MNANWNDTPAQIEDTTAMQGDLLMLLSGQQVTVHTSEEPDFDYMEKEDVAFVVENPHGGENLLIELCAEFSMFFETWHGSYKATESEYEKMKQDITAILGGQAAALTLYGDGRWLGSVLCTPKPAADADAAALLSRPEVPAAMAEKVRKAGGRAELICWDPQQNWKLVVPAEQGA